MKIAFDLDDTLFNNRNTLSSKYLWKLYKHLCFESKAICVTFRHRFDKSNPISIENSQYSSLYTRDEFIKNAKLNLGFNHDKAVDLFNKSIIHYANIKKTYPYFNLGVKNGLEYWKAFIAFKNGCYYLIDDLYDSVSSGCAKYNIKYIHPNSYIELAKSEFEYFYVFKNMFLKRKNIKFKEFRKLKNNDIERLITIS